MLTRRDFISRGAVAMAGLWIAGCTKRGSQGGQATHDGVLLRGNGTEPEALDPHIVRGAPEWTVVAALFEGLVSLDPQTLAPIPATAERWEVSADGLTYTFHLRADARWSDGEPLTAQDFLWSAQRLISPALGAAHVEDTLIFVRGVEAYAKGASTDLATVGVRAPDARTLVFELVNPTPFFPGALVQFYPVRRAVVEKFGGATDRGSAWTRPGNLVGNGPFRLARWSPNQEIACVKNAHYWDASRVRLNGVNFYPFENPTTEEVAFRNGQLHLTSSLPLQKIEVYKREHPELLEITGDLGNYFYPFNTTKPPFNDARVRRAFSLATDRESLVRNVVKGGKRAALSFTPPDMGGYTANPRLRFDVMAARAALAEAGFAGGAGFPAFELVLDSRDYHRVIAEALQQMWQTNLGVRVTLRTEETRVLLASKREMQFDLIRGSWNANVYQDPWFFLAPWVTGGLYNEAKWSDARYDALIAEAGRTADNPKRLGLLRDAEDILLGELPVLPLYWGTQVFLKALAVKGYSGKPFADRMLKYLWLE